MYRWMFSLLPGPVWVRWLIVLALLVAVFFLLMEYVFPWVSQMMPYTDVAV